MLDDLEDSSHDSDGLNLLTSVSSGDYGYLSNLTSDGTNDSFDDWAKGLLEWLLLVSSSSVWDEDSRLGSLDGDVVSEHFLGGQTIISVLSVEFWNGVELGLLNI